MPLPRPWRRPRIAVQLSFHCCMGELILCVDETAINVAPPRRSTHVCRSGYDTFSEQNGETSMSSDKVAAFAGTLAEFYDRYLVPLNFAPYAEVVADHAKALLPRRVLETAAGTGVATEALARLLPPDGSITTTDLNQPMIHPAKANPAM